MSECDDAPLPLALTARLIRAVDAEDSTAEALAVLRTMLGADRAFYYARNPVDRTLVLAHATAGDLAAVRFFAPHHEDDTSIAAQTLREGRPIIRAAFRTEAAWERTVRERGYSAARNLVSLPVGAGGGRWGVVQAVNVAPAVLTGDGVSLTEITALFCAVLESAERRRELATLGDTVLRVNRSLDLDATFDAILDGMMTLVPSLTGAVYLDGLAPDVLTEAARRIAGKGERYPVTQPRPFHGSLTGWVYRNRTPVLVPDVFADPRVLRFGPDALPSDTDVRSYIMVPMLAQGEPVGVLVCSRRGIGAFSERDLGVVERLAPLAAQAVANARLYESAERGRRSTEALLEDFPDAVMTLGLDGRVVGWNKGADRMFGFAAVELMGQYPPVIPFDVDARYAGTWERVLAGASFVGIENRQQHRNGQWLDALVSISPRRAAGQIIGAIVVIRDITALKRLEVQLKAEVAAGERRARDQAYIAAVAQACNSNTDGPAKLQCLADLSAQWADSASVVTFLEGRGTLAAVAAREPGRDDALAPHLDSYVETLTRLLHDNPNGPLFTPATIDLRRFASRPPFIEATLACGIHTIAFVPIHAERGLVGALAVGARDETPPFDGQALETLRLVAEQAGLAITKDRLLQQVEAQVRELEEASRHKDDFLASLSHELRTPLNAILGFGQMIADGQLHDDEVYEAASDIVSGGRLLLGQVNDLLDMARAAAGQTTVQWEAVQLAPLIAACERVLLPLVSQKQQALHALLPPDLPPVRADATRLRQVLLNLLTNAHKFTPEGGVILVRAWQTDETVFIAVADTGIGIAPEHTALVFEPFRRVEMGYARKQSGTGLGLALSRNLMELMGGTLTLESISGEGSTFTLSLAVSR